MKEEKKTGTYEWAPARDNCILGCSNDCRYCYASGNAVRFKRETKETWKIEHPNLKARAKKHRGRVMFPTSHDLHIEHLTWWGPHLQKLLELGNDVLIVTKPESESIHFICQNFSHYRDQMEFRFTLGTPESSTTAYWEPGAPAPHLRAGCFAVTHRYAIKTSLSMEPLLIEDPAPMIQILDHFITGEIWIGMMNHYALNPSIPQEARQIKIQSKENLQRVYDTTKDNPKVRYKDSMRDLLGLPPNP